MTNYIDDIISHFVHSKLEESFNTLHKLLVELSFEISHKVIPPSIKVTCAAIDTKTFTVSITVEKIKEIIDLCKIWKDKTH